MSSTVAFTANSTWQAAAVGPLNFTLEYPGTRHSDMYIGNSAPNGNTTNIYHFNPVTSENFIDIALDTGDTMYVKASKAEQIVTFSWVVDTTSGSSGGGSSGSTTITGTANVAVVNTANVSITNSAVAVTPPGSAVVVATFTRPADTVQYAIGDLIANSTANTSVVPMSLSVARANNATGMIRKLRVKTNDTAWASKNVRVHLYRDSPTITQTAGDNGGFLTTESTYIGYSDVLLDRHFSDYEKGFGVASVGSEFVFVPSSGTANIFALLEARDAVTPGSAKTWEVAVEVIRD